MLRVITRLGNHPFFSYCVPSWAEAIGSKITQKNTFFDKKLANYEIQNV